MNKLRIGIILSYNKEAGFGLIKDVNNERIIFPKCEMRGIPIRGSLVSFDICLDGEYLRAVNIKIISASSSSNVNGQLSSLKQGY